MVQRPIGFIQYDAPMAENFLKLYRSFAALMYGQIGFASHLDGIHVGPVVKRCARAIQVQTEWGAVIS
jgi:hypothetical protein